MIKLASTIVLVVLLALSAGVVTGVTLHHAPSAASVAEQQSRPALAEQLQLTDDQAQRMQQIWEQVRDKVDSIFIDAQELEKGRDQSVFAMLTPEQKTKFAALQKDYAAHLAALKSRRDGMFNGAVKQTEEMLTESQRKQYRQIIAQRLERKPGAEPDWLPKEPIQSPEQAQ